MFQTGNELRVKRQQIKKITTGCKELDAMIGGATNTTIAITIQANHQATLCTAECLQRRHRDGQPDRGLRRHGELEPLTIIAIKMHGSGNAHAHALLIAGPCD